MILQRREFANYLRETQVSKLTEYRVKYRCGCAEARYYHLGGNEFAPAGGLNIAVRDFNI